MRIRYASTTQSVMQAHFLPPMTSQGAHKSGNTDLTNHIDHRTVLILSIEEKGPTIQQRWPVSRGKGPDVLDLHEFLEMRMLQFDRHAPARPASKSVDTA